MTSLWWVNIIFSRSEHHVHCFRTVVHSSYTHFSVIRNHRSWVNFLVSRKFLNNYSEVIGAFIMTHSMCDLRGLGFFRWPFTSPYFIYSFVWEATELRIKIKYRDWVLLWKMMALSKDIVCVFCVWVMGCGVIIKIGVSPSSKIAIYRILYANIRYIFAFVISYTTQVVGI